MDEPLVCTNSDGNGGICGVDLNRPGSMLARVPIDIPVTANGNGVKFWVMPRELPESVNFHRLICAECGNSVDHLFPHTTIRRCSTDEEE